MVLICSFATTADAIAQAEGVANLSVKFLRHTTTPFPFFISPWRKLIQSAPLSPSLSAPPSIQNPTDDPEPTPLRHSLSSSAWGREGGRIKAGPPCTTGCQRKESGENVGLGLSIFVFLLSFLRHPVGWLTRLFFRAKKEEEWGAPSTQCISLIPPWRAYAYIVHTQASKNASPVGGREFLVAAAAPELENCSLFYRGGGRGLLHIFFTHGRGVYTYTRMRNKRSGRVKRMVCRGGRNEFLHFLAKKTLCCCICILVFFISWVMSCWTLWYSLAGCI